MVRTSRVKRVAQVKPGQTVWVLLERWKDALGIANARVFHDEAAGRAAYAERAVEIAHEELDASPTPVREQAWNRLLKIAESGNIDDVMRVWSEIGFSSADMELVDVVVEGAPGDDEPRKPVSKRRAQLVTHYRNSSAKITACGKAPDGLKTSGDWHHVTCKSCASAYNAMLRREGKL